MNGPVEYLAIAFASRDAAIAARLRVSVAELVPEARVVRSRARIVAVLRELATTVDARAHAEALRARLATATADEGLSAGVYGVPVAQDPAWRALLNIPDELRIVAGVTIGRGAPDPGWSEKTSRATQRRRALDELVKWNTWSS